MSKRSKRRIAEASRGAGRRQTAAPRPRLPTRALLVSAGLFFGIVLLLLAAFLGSQGLSGIQTGPPPWRAETTQLRARLGAIGLPALTSEGQVQHTHQHLDLYVDGRQVTVPADIGIDRVAGYLAPIHTHDATGIIHVESPVVRDFTLGAFFDVWGVRFDNHCIGGECDGNGRLLSVFVNGQAFAGDPRSIVLVAHQEIVVAIGIPDALPKPIPASYAFPAGL